MKGNGLVGRGIVPWTEHELRSTGCPNPFRSLELLVKEGL